MVENLEEKLIYYDAESDKALLFLSEMHGLEIKPLSLQLALSDTLGYNRRDSHMIIERNLSSDDMINLLRSYDFRQLQPEILASVELDESILPDGIKRRLTEAEVRTKNQIWVVNKYDPDKFAIHAHNLESGLKLDLSDGLLYDAHNNPTKKTVRCKKLLMLRSRFAALNIALPPLAERCR